MAREVQLAFGQPSKRRVGDLPEPLGVHLLDDAVLDVVLVRLIVRVHVAEQLLQQVRREDLADTSKTWSVRFGSRSSSICRSRSRSFCSTRPSRVFVGDEVEDEAVVLLAVAVDAAHALLQADRVPGDVVVDHEPAELQVDAFAGGLGGDQDLGDFAELALGVDAACPACRGRRSSCRRGSA